MKEITQAKDDARALLEMYQAGFLDGTGKKWDDVKENCKKAFEFRFINKVQKKLKKRKI